MKNKKILYILIPAVVIIWGLIVYKIITYLTGEPTSSLFQDNPGMKPQQAVTKETYTLIASNPDPFGLNDHPSGSSVNGKKRVKAETVWPEVKFYGVLIAGKKKNSVASLRINDCNIVMKAGDTCQGVRLAKISESTVTLRYKGEKKDVSLDQNPIKK